MRILFTIGFLTLMKLFQSCSGDTDFTEYVDPYIGTVNCRWFYFTPAAVPMGMAKLAPHTNAHYGNSGGWEPVGYDYRDNSIEGFGHFHEFQVGGIVTMPVTGKIRTVPGDTGTTGIGYRSAFARNSEIAEPGYYSVVLDDYNIKVELTATERVGFHRYTFPAGKQAHILFDVGNQQGESGPVKDAQVTLTSNNEVEGYVVTYPVYVRNYHPGREVRIYFVARPDADPDSWGTFRNDSLFTMQKEISGAGAGMYLTYNSGNSRVIGMKVGLSYTGIDNARDNLNREAGNLSFDEAHDRAKELWNKALGRIEVRDGSTPDKTKFYTGLYHALSGRGISSDVNGSYPRCDGGVGKILPDSGQFPAYPHYNTDATWGAFWNLEQVWALAYPGIFSRFVRSNLDVYKDCGWLPDGVASGCFVPGVPSNFMGLAIASAYNHGIRDFDVDLAFRAALKNELEWRDRPAGVGKYDTRDFIEKGFITNDFLWQGWKFSASHTLEYCFSAFAVSEMARSLNKNEDAGRLASLASGYRNLFDPECGFMRPKERDGSFVKEFTPEMVWNGFQEGNSWQYTWYVPQDIKGLIDLMGEDRFNARLDSIFRESEKLEFGGGKQIHSFSGLEAVYNHGNQPSLHISYLFNYSGKPWLTQKWKTRICNTFYGIEPLHGYGYGQDEDQGQLGAWFVMAALGLFDVQGGARSSPVYQLSNPLFTDVAIHLDQDYYPGKTFRISCRKESDTSCYIRSARLNGIPLEMPWITHQDIIRGGILEFDLTDSPDVQWCRPGYRRPPSMSD